MNKYTGTVKIDLGGKAYMLCFNYKAIAELKTTLGADVLKRLFTADPILVADILAVACVPAITKEEVMEISPPVVPTINLIDKALEYAYHGPEGKPVAKESVDDKKNTEATQ